MIAAVVPRYGPLEVVELRELPTPVAGPGQVLVRVRATSLNPLDVKLRSGSLRPFLRLRFPAVLGFDLAGEVAAIGPGVDGFAIGQRVYGRTDSATGGAHAGFAVVGSRVLDLIPERLSFEQAASLPLVAMTAVQGLRDVARLRAGQRLLVSGASGGVGTAAIQVGRALGAVVTAATRSEDRALLARLGAADLLDPPDTRIARAGEPFDVVFDTAGRMVWRDVRRWLAPRGSYVTTGFGLGLAVRGSVGRLWRGRRIRLLVSRADGALMRAVSELVGRGQLQAVIDSEWPLARIREAYARLEAGPVRGKIVLTLP